MEEQTRADQGQASRQAGQEPAGIAMGGETEVSPLALRVPARFVLPKLVWYLRQFDSVRLR